MVHGIPLVSRFGATLSLGYPLLIVIGAAIWSLISECKPESVTIEKETNVRENKTLAVDPPVQVPINKAKLRSIFDSTFMNQWSDVPGKTYLDRVIKDLQFVKDNFKKGAKQDKEHFSTKNVIEIAEILHKDKYFKRVYNSFADWCCTLFECLGITPPDKQNIKKNQETSDIAKRRFYYLLKK